MPFFEKYLSYWPPLAGTLLFLLLGLLLWIVGGRAMERSKKELDWVRKYRKSGFFFGEDNLKTSPISRFGVLAVLAGGALFATLYQMNTSMSLLRNWTIMLSSRYSLFRIALSALGAVGVYLLLRVLFDNLPTAVLGTLLFITAPRPGYEPCCLLALCLLFLLLYLRSAKTGFPTEFLYLLGVAFYLMCLALWQELVWLAPFVIVLHWFKLSWYSRNNKLPGRRLAAVLVISLLAWAALLCLCALLRVFLLAGFRMYRLRSFDSAADFGRAIQELIQGLGQHLFKLPMRSLVLDPMIAAPVLGLGFWGLLFAVGQLRKRKSVRAAFVLAVSAAFGLTWLLTGISVLLLPLLLAACFLVRGAVAGSKTRLAAVICLLGVLFHLGMAVGAWALPMITELRIRMF